MPTHGFAPPSDVTVVLLAGGGSRRFGGDKLAAPLGSATVLDAVLGGLPPDCAVVVVGPERPTLREVRWTREEPAGGGPLAGVAAGALVVESPLVAVVAGDMPDGGRAVPVLADVLRHSGTEVTGAVAVDGTGRPNPLLSVWRTEAVRAALPDDARGLPARTLLGLPHVEVAVDPASVRDIDTRADLAALRDPPVSGRGGHPSPHPAARDENPSG